MNRSWEWDKARFKKHPVSQILYKNDGYKTVISSSNNNYMGISKYKIWEADFSALQNEFASYIKKGSRILDLGCGSGRDSKAFIEKGYEVLSLMDRRKYASEHLSILGSQ